jgi:hypothetical protein
MGLSELIADTVSGIDKAEIGAEFIAGVAAAGTAWAARTLVKVTIAVRQRKNREATRMYFQREVISSVHLDACGSESYRMR